ncbi:MAG: hypothetical protein K8S54_18625 [Spirochaetia bacterium]|nr:hypothetical protein [Spirochaetia bacterium]
MPHVSLYVQIYVLAGGCLTAGLIVVALLRVAKRVGLSPMAIRYLIVGGLYLLISSVIAYFGGLTSFEQFPPRGVLLLVFWILAILFLAQSSEFAKLLAAIPMTALFEIQTFRILAEILIFWLILEEAMPHSMSFTGRNFDILVPLTAPLVSYVLFRRQVFAPATANRIAILWNVAGFAILAITVFTGIFSLPTPKRIFFEGPSTAIIFAFPFHILPGFWVPLAFGVHVLSISKLLRERGIA